MRKGALNSYLADVGVAARITVKAESGIEAEVHHITYDKETDTITLHVRGAQDDALMIECASEGQEFHERVRAGEDPEKVMHEILYERD